jgi:hypothetical protein
VTVGVVVWVFVWLALFALVGLGVWVYTRG